MRREGIPLGPRIAALMDYAQSPVQSRASFVMWVEAVLALEPIPIVDARDQIQRGEVDNFQLLEDPSCGGQLSNETAHKYALSSVIYGPLYYCTYLKLF